MAYPPPLSVDCSTPACASGGYRKLAVPAARSFGGQLPHLGVGFRVMKEPRCGGREYPFPGLDTETGNLVCVAAALCA